MLPVLVHTGGRRRPAWLPNVQRNRFVAPFVMQQAASPAAMADVCAP
jgi:hypothetical protein